MWCFDSHSCDYCFIERLSSCISEHLVFLHTSTHQILLVEHGEGSNVVKSIFFDGFHKIFIYQTLCIRI